MPRNGSGTYNLVVNSWNPSVNGVTATAADWQTLINDIQVALTGSVSADGQTVMSGNLQMSNNKLTGLAAGAATGQSLRWEQLFDQGVETDIASAATTDIGLQNTNFLRITGTTTITSFGTNYRGPRFIRFGGALTLTHNASTLILPGNTNIVTAIGDRAIVAPIGSPGSGWQVIAYFPATGIVSIANGGTGQITSAAAFSALKQSATETISGVLEIATSAETTALTLDDKIVTPLKIKDAFNASGSAPLYACRAWVNFNGTGTPAIRASGNVTSITDNGIGDYTVNFTTAIQDANYSAVVSSNSGNNGSNITLPEVLTILASSVRIRCIATGPGGGGGTDPSIFCVSIFR